MSNSQNNDLITEVLNQDPKYLAKKEIDEKSFKAKIKAKKASPLDNFQKMIQRGTLRFAFSLFLFVFGITLGNLALNNNFKNNQSYSSNVQPTSSLVSDQDQVSRFALTQDKNALSSSASNLVSQKEQSGSSVIPEINKNDNNTSSKSQTQDMVKPEYSVKLITYETVVENSSVGEKINFKYDPNTKILYFDGLVTGNDGCSYLQNTKLEKSADKVILNYTLAKKSGFCIQILTEIKVQGSQAIDLSQDELQNFKNLFTIQKI